MDADQRTRDAIIITRTILSKALTSPFTMVHMTMFEEDPEHVQDKVYDILCYLEKTRPVKAEEAEGDEITPDLLKAVGAVVRSGEAED